MVRKRYFGDRLHELPLILAGPILRQVNTDSISVWFALKQPADLKLKIFSTQDGQGKSIESLEIETTCKTIQIGRSLHLALITAYGTLRPSQIYAYDVEIKTAQVTIESLSCLSPRIYGNEGLSYFDHGLPTFATTAAKVEHLKLMHGSCRKPHGKGADLLLVLDDLLQTQAQNPTERIQQLYFTGDQIYGDDVADPLLWVATDVGDMLLGWTEELPIDADRSIASYELIPGVRSQYAQNRAGLTSAIGNSDDIVSSHFFSFGEYLAAYLLGWSPYLWPLSFPKGQSVQKDISSAKQWDRDVQCLRQFIDSLPKIRRSLANVATYMICDDHDVSDDWYLNREWCERVLGSPLGYRVVFNALLAYAFCQAWGNTPGHLIPQSSGEALAKAVTRWSLTAGQDQQQAQAIAAYLGLPPVDSLFRLDGAVEILNRNPRALCWHYQVNGICHEVLVADTRTWRGYPLDDAIAPPMLLSPTAFDQQLAQPLTNGNDDKLTFVLLPTNVVCLSLIDSVQQRDLAQNRVFRYDVGDAWNFHTPAFTQLIQTLGNSRQHVIILTGDIHYSCAVKMQFWPELQKDCDRVSTIVQLTSSAIKNAEIASQFAHTRLKSLIPEPTEDWVGWPQSPTLESQICTEGRCYRQKQNTDKSTPTWYPTSIFTSTQGNPALNWTARPTLKHSPPEWRLNWTWVPRAPQQPTAFTLKTLKPTGLKRWLSWLWINPWIQSGPTVVGHNNIGVVSIKYEDGEGKIIQDCYWVAPWTTDQIVKSQYVIPLETLQFKTGDTTETQPEAIDRIPQS